MSTDFNAFFGPRLERMNWLLILLFSTCAMFWISARAGASIALGGVISTINFHWLKQAVDFIILKGAEGRVGKRVALQYAGRYALIAVVLYVTLRFSVLDPVFVLAGLLTYVLAVLLEAVFEIVKFLLRDYRNGKV